MTDKEIAHSPLPWRKNCALWDYPIISGNEIIARVQFEKQNGMTEDEINIKTEANADFIIKTVNAHSDLVAALKECRQEMRQILGEIQQLALHCHEEDVVKNIKWHLDAIPMSGHNYHDTLELIDKTLTKHGIK